MYQRKSNQSTKKIVEKTIACARASARRALDSRQREIKILPSYFGDGWDCMEFTDGGASWLASNVTWVEAMNAGGRFMRDVLLPWGLQPHVEIRIAHESNAPRSKH